MTKSPPRHPIAELRSIIESLPEVSSLSQRRRKVLETELREVVEQLGERLAVLDPIGQPTSIFDPSNPKVVGRFISLALVAQQRHALSTIPRTYGSGVYAIYYTGEFAAYSAISKSETPIYVGQAAPIVSNARTPREQGPRLCSRLSDHRKNIAKAASTLKLEDFEFRSLVVQSGWETAAEDYLIHLFRPIWNSETNILYGLGKHGDSAETRANSRSPWDTLHPGRAWAAKSKADAKSPTIIEKELGEHFSKNPPFQSMDEVLASFLEELRQV
jgi:hypothetical protein